MINKVNVFESLNGTLFSVSRNPKSGIRITRIYNTVDGWLQYGFFFFTMKREEEILDTWRTVIPTWQLGLYTLSPIAILFILSIAPIHILSTKLKSVLALPLLTLLVIFPIYYREPDNGM
jgi:hypothetical protein